MVERFIHNIRTVIVYSYITVLTAIALAPSTIKATESGKGTKSCACNCCTTLFLPRPQGLDSAALYNPFYYGSKAYCDRNCSAYTIGYRYNETFNGKKNIAPCLFGTDKLAFIGSQVETTTPTSDNALVLQAEDFGLAPGFKGSMTFDPRIRNNIIDLTARWQLGCLWNCLDGFYVGVNGSLVQTSWNLRPTCMQEWVPCNLCPQSNNTMPRCFISSKEEGAFGSIQEALSGTKSIGDMKGPWQFGRFVFDEAQTAVALANLDLVLGYNIFDCPDYHLGVFLRTSAPTGNQPKAETFFEPIVGNGHHWELGGGLDAHWDFWHCDDQYMKVYLVGSINHLFNDRQWRTFDFKDCCMSRYTMLKEFDQNGRYVRLINGTEFTVRKVDSSFAVQGDAALGLIYHLCGWAFGIGYNIYGRSAEKISRCLSDNSKCEMCDEGRCDLENRRFGKKGLNGVCLFSPDNRFPDWRLSATDSTSCISKRKTAASVDNPLAINDWFGTDFETWNGLTDSAVLESGSEATVDGVKSIIQKPVLVTTKDLDFKGVPQQITHKIFGHVDYQWEDYECQPYLGFGWEAEFAQTGDCSCAASQWGLWIRGGINF